MLTRMVACSWKQDVSHLLLYSDKFFERGYAFRKD